MTNWVCKRDTSHSPSDFHESFQGTTDVKQFSEVNMLDFLLVKLEAGVKMRQFVAQVTDLAEGIVISFLR